MSHRRCQIFVIQFFTHFNRRKSINDLVEYLDSLGFFNLSINGNAKTNSTSETQVKYCFIRIWARRLACLVYLAHLFQLLRSQLIRRESVKIHQSGKTFPNRLFSRICKSTSGENFNTLRSRNFSSFTGTGSRSILATDFFFIFPFQCLLICAHPGYSHVYHFNQNRRKGESTGMFTTSTTFMPLTTRISHKSQAVDVVDSSSSPTIRKTFPESWIFDTIEASHEYIFQSFQLSDFCW